jgi:hypothetical protein
MISSTSRSKASIVHLPENWPTNVTAVVTVAEVITGQQLVTAAEARINPHSADCPLALS